MDRVRFTHAGATHTVYLRDVIRQTVHSDSALYLKGRVVLPVSAAHLADLLGRFSIPLVPAVRLPPGRDA